MSSSIAAIHVAKKQLGLDDDTYRAKLKNITGESSTKTMTEEQRQKVLTVFRNEGFQPVSADRRADGRQKLSGRYAKKLQALWIAGWNLGIFRNRDDKALEAFVKRQTGLDAIRFCHDAADARKAIEALRAIIAREGGVDWSVHAGQAAPSHQDGCRIAQAQWKMLLGEAAGFWSTVHMISKVVRLDGMTEKDWIPVMNHFGERIRKEKAAAQ